MATKKELAVFLSKLKTFENPKMIEEQYTLDSEVVADILWNAFMNNDIQGKIIADFGCGTGIIGIGALLLGAKKVYFIDKDKEVFKNLFENIKITRNINKNILNKVEILNMDIRDFEGKADVVIMNPPWGTKMRHIDKDFLRKAFETANIIYVVNKVAKHRTIKLLAYENNYKVTQEKDYLIRLKKTMKEHRAKVKVVKIVCLRLHRLPKPL